MSKKHCIACGNNPTNHTLSYIHNTASIYVEPIDEIVFGTWIGTIGMTIFNWATVPYLFFFKLIRFISWNTDVSKVATDRSRVIWEEANRRGIPMRQLVIMGKPVDMYQARINGSRIMFESIPRPRKLTSSGDSWLDDKYTLKTRLAKHNIPVPRGKSVTSYREACEVFDSVASEVITKPRLGSRGRHTTTHINSREALEAGFTSAQQLCHQVIVEEHLEGSVYRGTVVGGELVGFLEGAPARITGNGHDSIRTLIAEKNKTRNPKVSEVVCDDKLERFLTRTGHTYSEVLPAGTTIDLSEKIGISYGGSSRELITEIHPKIRTILEHAGRIVGSPVVGFDFIILDPTVDPDTQKCGIIECNSLPFINLHHHPLVGTPVNVAGRVWDLFNRK